MNTEQERAEFEAWWESTPVLKENKRTIAEKAYQAGRAAQQSQDREDAARLDWLQQSDGRFFKLLHITSIVGRGFSPTNSSGKWFPSLREAVDHARRVEGDGE